MNNFPFFVLLPVLLYSCWFSQTERHSPLLGVRSRPSLDGGKMRASVRMTRYLESWGAAKPFANLHHRDSMTTDNGKINTTVSSMLCSQFSEYAHTYPHGYQLSFDQWSISCFRMFQWGNTTSREEKGKLGAMVHSVTWSHSVSFIPFILHLMIKFVLFNPGPNLKGGGLRRSSMSG